MLALTVAPMAMAQSEGGPLGQTGGSEEISLQSTPLIINMERVLREADAARSIQTQAEQIRQGIQASLAARQSALRGEEQELVDLRQTMAQEEFQARVASFEERVRALKRDSNELGSRLQKALFQANEELKQRLRPELIAIMRERQAAVMIDERYVVISARALDVTSEAIARINESSPRIEVRWTAEDADPGGSDDDNGGDGSTEGAETGDTSGGAGQTGATTGN